MFLFLVVVVLFCFVLFVLFCFCLFFWVFCLFFFLGGGCFFFAKTDPCFSDPDIVFLFCSVFGVCSLSEGFAFFSLFPCSSNISSLSV